MSEGSQKEWENVHICELLSRELPPGEDPKLPNWRPMLSESDEKCLLIKVFNEFYLKMDKIYHNMNDLLETRIAML